MPLGCPRFVAPSYVWGHHPDPAKLFATKANIEALGRDGGLPGSDMPATVEDAMEVCRRLGEPYLWVDRLCITQDDDGHKAEQIAAMAAIYSLAELVIVVTDGDSDSGIAGVSRERPQGQVHDRISGLDFIISDLPPLGDIALGGSVWSTRG
jgi:hypothetical protein